ncbi:hypothetical protein DSO57_1007038 [Entomophthora muscae]|uniref:Uncharacterized protein n=1 Tax=Entomophthora muscae TaxID=34485 RepID=A0ACC2RMA8_9FUNG|nr:hypothetical protein DSO57_1007038 [Entomophthora muscae]
MHQYFQNREKAYNQVKDLTNEEILCLSAVAGQVAWERLGHVKNTDLEAQQLHHLQTTEEVVQTNVADKTLGERSRPICSPCPILSPPTEKPLIQLGEFLKTEAESVFPKPEARKPWARPQHPPPQP